MANRPKTPTGKVCWTCTASDGRVVRLYKDTYYGHINNKNRHPEIPRDYDYPATEIEDALMKAPKPPKPEASHQRISYIGPPVQPKAPKAGLEEWKVVVQPDDDGGKTGWVVAAYPRLLIN